MVGLGRTWAEWWLGTSSIHQLAPPNSVTAECYSDDLNDQLIAMCRRGDPACQGENVAALLELDYCDDYWDQMVREAGYISITNALLLAGVAVVGSYLVYTEITRRASLPV